MCNDQQLTNGCTGQISAVTFCAKIRTKAAIKNLLGEPSVMFLESMRKILIWIVIVTSWNVMASYRLHIERQNQISESEWLSVCESDSSLTVHHVATATNPHTGEVIEIQTPNSCIWISPILRKKYYFTYSNGSITLGTDKAQIKKAKKLARLLGAKVVGDEGEEY